MLESKRKADRHFDEVSAEQILSTLKILWLDFALHSFSLQHRACLPTVIRKVSSSRSAWTLLLLLLCAGLAAFRASTIDVAISPEQISSLPSLK